MSNSNLITCSWGGGDWWVCKITRYDWYANIYVKSQDIINKTLNMHNQTIISNSKSEDHVGMFTIGFKIHWNYKIHYSLGG